MITNLNDKDTLEYLMTSEFEEGLTPDEMKFLLSKYRYFYRLLSGKNERISDDIKFIKNEMDNIQIFYNKKIDQILSEKAIISNELSNYKSHKLTLKERITGKINF